MTTRWFVEVSPVDADTLKERYCVEAVQWQQALQQARKLRGDRGPFSRFNIELLDLGYRATDPAAKLRYMVSKAPEDAPLTGGFASNGARQSSRPPAGRSKIPLPKSRPPEAASPRASRPPIDPAPSPRASRPPIDPAAPMSIAVLAQTGAVAPPAAPPPQPKTAATGHSAHPVLAPPRPSSAAVARESSHLDVADPARTEDSAVHVVEPIPLVTPHASKAPEGSAVAATNPGPPASPTHVEETIPSLPGLELIAFRREEPTEAIPITYREFSFAVAPGLSARELERYARAAWEQVRTSLNHRPDGKFVQIAIFDHHFSARPERPPLAVLGWKDWRGDPVVQIRRSEVAARGSLRSGASGPAPDSKASISVPRPSEGGGAANPALRPFDADVALSMRRPGQIGGAAPVEQPILSTQDSAEVPGFPLAAASASIPIAPEAVVVRNAPEPAPAPLEPLPVAAPMIVEAAPAAAVSAPPVAVEAPAAAQGTFPDVAGSVAPSVPSKRAPLAPLRGKKPAARIGSSPRAAGRAGPHDDLISDLFDDMHQLHFMPDLKSGAEYVLTVLHRMLPSEGAIIHVFDINAREFAIVRALGPKPGNVLLIRTPDTFPLFRDAFRRGRTMRFAAAQEEEGFRGGRWELLGVTANVTAVGPVHQGGRYLGLIELANPERGDPFYDTELNAIDYICEQFATFVASKPIVLEEDAILP